MDHNYLLVRATSFVICGGCLAFCGILANRNADHGSFRDGWSRLSMIYGAGICGVGIALLLVALEWLELGGLEP